MRSLLLLFVFVGVACGQPFGLYNPSFKDPYSSDTKGALLDVYLLPCKPWSPATAWQLQSITVQTPTAPTASTTGYFVGPSFTARKITGNTTHGGLHAVDLWISWDSTTRVFTFTGFSDPAAGNVVAPANVDPHNPNWVNVNWDIPDDTFVNPLVDPLDPLSAIDSTKTTDITKVPLALFPFVTDDIPNILIVDKPSFAANRDTTFDCKGGSSTQDPIFSGFQGQVFQFHGLPDEHFNLVSSPDVQLNSHFVYLSSGKCDYNDTECWTHPGTYMNVLGFSIIDTHIKIVAGTHEQGLRIWLNDQEIPRGSHVKHFTNISAHIKYHHNGRVEIHTEIMNFEIANSDMFMNVHVALNNRQLLRVGGTRHSITDKSLCKTNTETHNHQLIETTVAAKYPVNTPLHGLIGQTWRNVKVCSKDWMGTVQDYITSDLFASDYHYNYFNW